MNIWQKLRSEAESTQSSFTVLAPMEDVTDIVFRDIITEEGKPDLFFTEFTNTDGLASRGHDKVAHRLEFNPKHKPIIAQIWGTNPETYKYAVKFCIENGFDGVDINMGCPVTNVVRKGGGAGMINHPDLAKELILTSKNIINEFATTEFALSVKTRIGFKEIDLGWINFLLEQPIDALSIHLRTWKEQSKVPAHWELANEIVSRRYKINKDIVLIGNGDIRNKTQIETYYQKYEMEGIMVGRGIFENPWLFDPTKDISKITPKYRLQLLHRHLVKFINYWDNRKNNQLIKKFFRMYIRDFEGASEIRKEIIVLSDMNEIQEKLKEYIKILS